MDKEFRDRKILTESSKLTSKAPDYVCCGGSALDPNGKAHNAPHQSQTLLDASFTDRPPNE